jgi:antirestriction protein ArdC
MADTGTKCTKKPWEPCSVHRPLPTDKSLTRPAERPTFASAPAVTVDPLEKLKSLHAALVDQQAAPEAPAEDSDNAFKRRYDSMEEKLEAFHAELEKAVTDLDTDENWLAYLDTMSKFHRYSFQNQMLIALQRPGATHVAGFNKWKEMGRHVNKGERGISILAPKTIRETEKDAAGKPSLDAKGKPVKRTKVIGFTTATVFDVAQTDGDPLPSIQRELSETPPLGFVQNLEDSIRRTGYEVSYEEITGGAHGYTSPTEKRVVIDSRLTPGSQAATLAHELGHIQAGHMERISEYHTGHGGHRGAIEVEAESVAYALCRNAGMKTPAETAGTYVAGWARAERDPEVVKKSAQAVCKAVKEILSDPAWKQDDEEA